MTSDAEKPVTWSKVPFSQFFNYHDEIELIRQLSSRGIDLLRGHGDLAAAVAGLDASELSDLAEKPEEEDLDDEERRVLEATKYSELAMQEVERGFPLLYAHSLVGLWGALEALIYDLLVAWLKNVPAVREREPITSVKVPLAEFSALGEDERLEYIAREIEQNVGARFKPGIAGHEALLETVGMSGPVDDSIKDKLYEMSKVRNVIVHRASIADTRFVEDVPWHEVEPGERITIDPEEYNAYHTAVGKYVLLLWARCCDILDHDPPSFPTVEINLGAGTVEEVAEQSSFAPEKGVSPSAGGAENSTPG